MEVPIKIQRKKEKTPGKQRFLFHEIHSEIYNEFTAEA